jgi:ribonucleoside-triphosphate reductase
MCCRLRLDNRELRKKGGGLFGANPLTGSIGVVTINLPRIGYLAENKEDFKQRLGHLMDLAKESLIIKRRVIEEFTEKGLYPYSRYFLEGIKERFGEYWKNHFNTIGLVGMNEACLNFLKEPIHSPKGKEFALEILDFMREKMGDYQKETNQLFNLEATPAEGTSYRFAREDRKRFKDIIFANDKTVKEGKAEPFYTNSTQLPVDYTSDIFEALEHQDDLQCKYTGGTVFHGFLGESMPDVRSLKILVKKIAEKFHLPYYTLTPTFSICPVHGYVAGEHYYCPKCDEDLSEKKSQLEKEGIEVIIEG